MIEDPGEAFDEIGAGDTRSGLETEPGIALVEESGELPETESAANPGIIAEFGMCVEREMGAVNGEVGFDEQPELLVAGTDPRVGRRPEKAMVDNEEVGLSRSGELEGG
jgi:hypothetical protein